jgi:hypothetical protein
MATAKSEMNKLFDDERNLLSYYAEMRGAVFQHLRWAQARYVVGRETPY